MHRCQIVNDVLMRLSCNVLDFYSGVELCSLRMRATSRVFSRPDSVTNRRSMDNARPQRKRTLVTEHIILVMAVHERTSSNVGSLATVDHGILHFCIVDATTTHPGE